MGKKKVSIEKNIVECPSDCEDNLTCIYVDANGLHELNNTKGHAAGVKMLQEVAKITQEQFEEKNITISR